jgi:hypothetical protein
MGAILGHHHIGMRKNVHLYHIQPLLFTYKTLIINQRWWTGLYLVKEYLFRGKRRNVMKPLGRPKKLSDANTQHVLVSPEAKERLEALKYDHKVPLGDVVLRLTNVYFTND